MVPDTHPAMNRPATGWTYNHPRTHAYIGLSAGA